MATLLINDLEFSTELDQGARKALTGGAFAGGLFNLDQLFSGINNGNVNSNIDLKASGNFLSPTVITNLALYLPVNTVVQLDLDNIISTETIAASNFSSGSA